MRYRLLKELPFEVATDIICFGYIPGALRYTNWADDIGDRDICRNAEYILLQWVKYIGDIKYMRTKLIEYKTADWWDKDILIKQWNEIYKGTEYEISPLQRTTD